MFKKNSPSSNKSFIFYWIIVGSIVSFILYDTYTHPFIPIEWTFENELDVSGFNIYRADSETGDYTRLNDKMLPPAFDPLVGGKHSFIDTHVEWQTTYYYRLESINRNGNAIELDTVPLSPKFIPLTHP